MYVIFVYYHYKNIICTTALPKLYGRYVWIGSVSNFHNPSTFMGVIQFACKLLKFGTPYMAMWRKWHMSQTNTGFVCHVISYLNEVCEFM